MMRRYDWPHPVVLHYDFCGRERAFWSREERKVLICDEYFDRLSAAAGGGAALSAAAAVKYQAADARWLRKAMVRGELGGRRVVTRRGGCGSRAAAFRRSPFAFSAASSPASRR